MQTLLEVLLITCLVTFVLVVMGVLIAWHAVRRLRRTARIRLAAAGISACRAASNRLAGAWSPTRGPGPDRLGALAGGAYVAARAWLPGPARAVWMLCRDLDRDVASAVFAVRAADQAGRPVQELEDCVARLTEHAREVQLDLRVIAAEPDAAARAHLLSGHAARVSLIRQTCANVRSAVLSGGSVSRQPVLERLVTDVNDAATAVRLRAAAYRELSSQ